MQNYCVKNAVAIVIFNRPNFTEKVFGQIKKVKPSKLYIIADAPRENNKEDLIRCEQARRIFDNIDWKCEVIKNFANVNMGCSKRPASGFEWVFQNEEQAIFLEDDCVPSISFFRYCDEMLEKYKNDNRVMLVSGTNVLSSWESSYSYHFSMFGGTNGWASWRRAWKYFDIEIKKWEDINVKRLLKDKLGELFYFERGRIYDKLLNNSSNTTAWDYQWGFARLINSGLAVVPSLNLITNIGYGEDSTHSKNPNSRTANLKSYELEFPMKHPEYMIVDIEFDKQMIELLSGIKILRIMAYLKRKILRFGKKYEN